MNINLWYLCKYKAGGYRSYVKHLCKSLVRSGHTYSLYTTGKTNKQAVLLEDIIYQQVTLQQAIAIAKTGNNLIVGAYWKSHSDTIEALLPYSIVIIHSGYETKQEIVKLPSRGIIANRAAVRDALARSGIDSVYIPYPYIPEGLPRQPKKVNAISLCRLVWFKQAHLIIEANKSLPPDKAIYLFGEVDSRYDYFKLSKINPNWKDHWGGKFTSEYGQAVNIAAMAKYVVNLSIIPHDGGGVEFVTLETFDAKAIAIVHQKWLDIGDNELNRDNCIPIATADDLVNVMLDDSPHHKLISNSQEVLQAHHPDCVIPMYEKLFRNGGL